MSDTERLSAPEESERSEAEVQKMIRDYEKKYQGIPSLEDILNDSDEGFEDRPRTDDFIREESYEKPKRSTSGAGMRKAKQSRRIATTEEERKWATIAHASAILTVLTGIFSAGFLALITLFIPLGIYLYWRRRSEYVAFQALQAFTLQVLGTVGWLALVVLGSIVFTLLAVVLAITLIGIPLLIILVPVFVLLVLASFGLPIGMVVYSIMAALQTNQGSDYRLPRIGRWIDRQMHYGFLSEI